MSVNNLISILKDNNQDFEYYPTTEEMLKVIYKDARRNFTREPDIPLSVLELGAGTASAAKFLSNGSTIYCVEKSDILRSKWDHICIPVGVDFFNTTLIGIKADLLFCNPPYSDFEVWSTRIINECSCDQLYLIIPSRWKNSSLIGTALKERKVESVVIFTGDFLDAERKARAKVDILRIDFRANEYGRKFFKVNPFELWYSKEFPSDHRPEVSPLDEFKKSLERESEDGCNIVSGNGYIERIASIYEQENNTLFRAYKSIDELPPNISKLLSLNTRELCHNLENEISSIRTRYWNELFIKYKPISSRLTSYGLKILKQNFGVQKALDFNIENILACTVWAIKQANLLYEEQLEEFMISLIDSANVKMYKSNKMTFDLEKWRYSRYDYKKVLTHYGLDYRIVLDRMVPFNTSSYSQHDYPNGLRKGCHDLINDILVVCRNLGFDVEDTNSYNVSWIPGAKYEFYLKSGDIAFTVKGFKKGTMHFQFNQALIRAMNVEFGRIKGWLKNKKEAMDELNLSEAEVEDFWKINYTALPSSSLQLLT